MLRKFLLICGIASSLLYVAVTAYVPTQWASYSSLSQTISELSAIGAPTRSLWVRLVWPYTLLTLAFAFGVWMSAGSNRALRIAGALLIAYGALGFVWPFAPMHLRQTIAMGASDFSDTMHITLGAVSVLLMFAAIVAGATAFGNAFRIYSIVTVVILILFGTLTFMGAPHLAKNLPTPWLGLWERINIGVFLLWVVTLATLLLRLSARAPRRANINTFP